MSNKSRSRDEERRAKSAKKAVNCLFTVDELDYIKSTMSPNLGNAPAVTAYVRDRIDAERGRQAGGAA